MIVVINKIDKPDARPEWALNATYDLFFELDATEEQIEFPVIYAAARDGKAGLGKDLGRDERHRAGFRDDRQIFPPPKKADTDILQMLTVNLGVRQL